MSLISKPYTFSNGTTIIASEHNSNYDTVYNAVNGNLDTTNLSASAAIPDSKLNQITTPSKVSGAALTSLSSTPTTAGGIGWANMPPGMPLAYPSSSVPTGCLALDGSSLLKATYTVLFAIYGTTYGTVDGTHFTLPDMRGLVIGGYKAADGNFGTIGGTGGEKTHILTTTEMPAHTHTIPTFTNGAGANPCATGVSAVGTVTSSSSGSDGAHNNLQPYMTWLWVTATGGQ